MKLLLTLAVLTVLSSCALFNSSNSNDTSEKTGEVLVDLKDAVDAEEFSSTKSIRKYKLTQKKVVSASMNIVLFAFDDRKIGTEELIDKLKAMDAVENAQSNKVINPR